MRSRSLRVSKRQLGHAHWRRASLQCTCLAVLQLVDLADSGLSGKIQHIPDNMYDLDADWEIDPKALALMEKIGDSQELLCFLMLEHWASGFRLSLSCWIPQCHSCEFLAS